MNEESYQTPRFNYDIIEEDKVNRAKRVKSSIKKKSNRRRKHRTKSLDHFLKKKMKYDSDIYERISIYQFLFKKFKLNNNFDKEHADIFLEEKEQAFQGYPETDEITE